MIELYYGNAMAARVGPDHGVTDDELNRACQEMRERYSRVQEELRSGKLGFAAMLDRPEYLQDLRRLVRERKNRVKAILHLGIGGSALGPQALHTALVRYQDKTSPELVILDNIDPVEVRSVLRRLDLKTTLVHVASKSGETTETLAVFMIVVRELKKKLGPRWARQIVVTTDPAKGFLREFAEKHGVARFEIPPNVGGRFSVLSPVGLVPLALCGANVEKILSGARRIGSRLKDLAARDNPAFMLALLHHVLDLKKGKSISIFMPYAEQLRDVAAWFSQLWAESLGKKLATDGAVVHSGQTPVAALGATDQHSQLQLYNEGPKNKMVTFLAVGSLDRDLAIPRDFDPHGTVDYLKGSSLQEILDAERKGTESALTAHQCPNVRLQFPKVSAESIGELLFFMEMQTVYAGALYRVNPFDQPGVEHSKRVTFGLLRRKGYPAPPTGPAQTEYRLIL